MADLNQLSAAHLEQIQELVARETASIGLEKKKKKKKIKKKGKQTSDDARGLAGGLLAPAPRGLHSAVSMPLPCMYGTHLDGLNVRCRVRDVANL